MTQLGQTCKSFWQNFQTRIRVINHPNICWRDNTAWLKPLGRFLECIDNLVAQVIKEQISASAVLDLMLTNKEELVGSLKVRSSLGCSDHKM